jgi:hypothetical protein
MSHKQWFIDLDNRKIKHHLPRAEQLRVGVVPKNPESVTSSTVSPIDKTRVAFTKDTMM